MSVQRRAHAVNHQEKISAEHVTGLSGADSSGYWWFATRHAFVKRLLRRVSANGPVDYLDFGCGTGGTLRAVLEQQGLRSVVGIDGTKAAVDVCVSRGLPARLADVERPLDLAVAPNAVTCLDVLEHLDDPVEALRCLAAVVSPEVELLVTVPSMPSLRSSWDDICGHRRRYTRRMLLEHLEAGGFEPTWTRHAFSHLVAPAFVQRVLLRRAQKFEFPPVSRPVNAILRGLGAVERWLGNPAPFGTSLVAFARLRK